MAKKKMYQRPDGLYEKKITIDGKRIAFRGKSEREVMQKIAAFTDKKSKGRTFKEVSDEWWAEHESKIRYGSVHTYKAAKRRADDYFSDTPIKDIEAADLNAFILSVSNKGYASKTVSNQLTVARLIFTHALMQRDIRMLPTDGVKIPRGLSRGTRVLASTSVVNIVKGTKDDEFLLPALILYTGARCGEALALQWKDVDFKANTVSITKAVVFHSNQPVVSETKTQKANRIVPLLEPFRKMLEAREHDAESDYIIGGEKPLTRSALSKQWEKYCRDHGLAHPNELRSKKAGRTIWKCDIDRHTFRHEYATILFDAGITEKDAQELLGHSDISTTMNIYTHIRQNRIVQTANTLNSFLSEKGTEKAQ